MYIMNKIENDSYEHYRGVTYMATYSGLLVMNNIDNHRTAYVGTTNNIVEVTR